MNLNLMCLYDMFNMGFDQNASYVLLYKLLRYIFFLIIFIIKYTNSVHITIMYHFFFL